jgi:hypothetical protein
VDVLVGDTVIELAMDFLVKPPIAVPRRVSMGYLRR